MSLLNESLCVVDYNEEEDAWKFPTQSPAFALEIKILVAVQLILTSGEDFNDYKPLFEMFSTSIVNNTGRGDFFH